MTNADLAQMIQASVAQAIAARDASPKAASNGNGKKSAPKGNEAIQLCRANSGDVIGVTINGPFKQRFLSWSALRAVLENASACRELLATYGE